MKSKKKLSADDIWLNLEIGAACFSGICVLIMSSTVCRAHMPIWFHCSFLEPVFVLRYTDSFLNNVAQGSLTMLGFAAAAWAMLISVGPNKAIYKEVAGSKWEVMNRIFSETCYSLAGCITLSYSAFAFDQDIKNWILKVVVVLVFAAAARVLRCIWLLHYLTRKVFEAGEEQAQTELLQTEGMTEEFAAARARELKSRK